CFLCVYIYVSIYCFFFQAEDGIRDGHVTGVQTCALPISEDYKKKGVPFVFDLEHSKCPNDGHELQVQNMTVMPSVRLSETDAERSEERRVGKECRSRWSP